MFLLLAGVAAAQSSASPVLVNAASYVVSAPVAPGSLATLFGNFDVTAPAQAGSLPLPKNLAGVSVQFGSVAAPLLYVSSSQVNLQVPWEVSQPMPGTLTISANGVNATAVVSLSPFAPGIFSLNAAGNGQGALLDSSYRLLDASHPAIGGSTIMQIYCTGLGPVTNVPPSGAAAPSSPLAETTSLPTVTIGGVPAPVFFAGLAPGLMGVYQVNVLVPPVAPAGNNVPVRLSIGGATSNTVTLAIAPIGAPGGPQITLLSPPNVFAGASSQTLRIGGLGLTSGTAVTFNGVPHAVSFIDSSDLTITLSAADLAASGKFPVVAVGATSAGGSLAITFEVDPSPSSAWQGIGRDAGHSAIAPAASRPLSGIRWQTAVDLAPQFIQNELLIHYGSPLITAANTVILPVKTGLLDGFRVEARNAIDGSLQWQMPSDYMLPPHDWTPEFGPALAAAARVYFPGGGGKVYFRDDADSASGPTGELAFYGLANYRQNPQAYDANVFINTPITADSAGNIYFGFLVTGATPLGLTSGIARIGADGHGTWMPVTMAAADPTMTEVVYNCAPAVDWYTSKLYVAVSNGDQYVGTGYLLALDSETLSPLARVRLKDPESGQDALLNNSGTASPTIGFDGDVYFGVLENPAHENHDRGWLLHFDALLAQSKTPGAFGWDEAASVVPSVMVPSYAGSSTSLLMTKYNDYGGNGLPPLYRIAIVDPNATEGDPITGVTVMKEVLTVTGSQEWCINSAAVDPATKSILAGSEDGKLYRWDLTTNTLSQSLVLSPGLGEAYTPTLVGPDGTVYAINDAILFAVE